MRDLLPTTFDSANRWVERREKLPLRASGGSVGWVTSAPPGEGSLRETNAFPDYFGSCDNCPISYESTVAARPIFLFAGRPPKLNGSSLSVHFPIISLGCSCARTRLRLLYQLRISVQRLFGVAY